MTSDFLRAGRFAAGLVFSYVSLTGLVFAQGADGRYSQTVPGPGSEQRYSGQRPQGMPPAGGPETAVIPHDPPPPPVQNVIPVPEELLMAWEKASDKLPKVEGEFIRREYESVFKVVKISTGAYYYETPDKGRMDLRPPQELPAGPINSGGVAYEPQADLPKTWICNGAEILDIDISNKSYNRIQIPEQFRGTRIGEGPLPFLFGMKADKLKQRYLLGLGSMHDPQRVLHIVAYPQMLAERREFQKAEVLLNPQTYLPTHVKLWDPAGTKETVYFFSKHEAPSSFTLKNPLSFNLLTYKLHRDVPAELPQQEREATQPSGRILR